MTHGQCRSCGAPLSVLFADLGPSPISNDFPTPEQAAKGERVYRFAFSFAIAAGSSSCKTSSSARCISTPTIPTSRHSPQHGSIMRAGSPTFRSSVSSSALNRASSRSRATTAICCSTSSSAGIPMLGIDPAANCAEAARECGVETIVAFFGREARRAAAGQPRSGRPDRRQQCAGARAGPERLRRRRCRAAEARGRRDVRVPARLELIARNEFDTIYHEHYSYLSLLAVVPLFARHGLKVIDVERLPTHGGSLRLYVRASAAASGRPARWNSCRRTSARPASISSPSMQHSRIGRRRPSACFSICSSDSRARERQIVGYGAPAKGTRSSTTAASARISSTSPSTAIPRSKAGSCPEPASRSARLTPSAAEARLCSDPAVEHREEIMADLAEIRPGEAKFIVPIPEPKIVV